MEMYQWVILIISVIVCSVGVFIAGYYQGIADATDSHIRALKKINREKKW